MYSRGPLPGPNIYKSLAWLFSTARFRHTLKDFRWNMCLGGPRRALRRAFPQIFCHRALCWRILCRALCWGALRRALCQGSLCRGLRLENQWNHKGAERSVGQLLKTSILVCSRSNSKKIVGIIRQQEKVLGQLWETRVPLQCRIHSIMKSLESLGNHKILLVNFGQCSYLCGIRYIS